MRVPRKPEERARVEEVHLDVLLEGLRPFAGVEGRSRILLEHDPELRVNLQWIRRWLVGPELGDRLPVATDEVDLASPRDLLHHPGELRLRLVHVDRLHLANI